MAANIFIFRKQNYQKPQKQLPKKLLLLPIFKNVQKFPELKMELSSKIEITTSSNHWHYSRYSILILYIYIVYYNLLNYKEALLLIPRFFYNLCLFFRFAKYDWVDIYGHNSHWYIYVYYVPISFTWYTVYTMCFVYFLQLCTVPGLCMNILAHVTEYLSSPIDHVREKYLQTS